MRRATKSAIANLVNDLDLRELMTDLLERIEALEDENDKFVKRAEIEQIIEDKLATDAEMELERKAALGE